jgi:type II secretory pathway pseudopilin PulG
MKASQCKRRAAFTLFELLVLIALVAILAAMPQSYPAAQPLPGSIDVGFADRHAQAVRLAVV